MTNLPPWNAICCLCENSQAHMGFIHIACPNTRCDNYCEKQAMLVKDYLDKQKAATQETSDNGMDFDEETLEYDFRNLYGGFNWSGNYSTPVVSSSCGPGDPGDIDDGNTP